MVAVLNAWLVYLYKRRLGAKLGETLGKMEKYHVAGILLVMYVALTQSRGPLAGLAVAYLLLQIPRFKNTKRATAVIAVVLSIGVVAANQYFTHYTDITDPYAVLDEKQESAVYRRTMLEVFKPVVEQGGLLGWSYGSIPKVQGLFMIRPGVQSVDNDFLFVHLAQGTLGYILMVLIAVESVRVPLVRSWRFKALEDRAFAFSMLGIMAILWITLTTVAMGEQLPQIAYLMIGWGQSIAPGFTESATSAGVASPGKFAFKRIFR